MRGSKELLSVTKDQIAQAAKRYVTREEWAVKDPLTYEAALLQPGVPEKNGFAQLVGYRKNRRIRVTN
jgi:hypothetical protein